MTLLDNSMFDDGSFECFNFWIADQDGTYQVNSDARLIQILKSRIERAMQAGHSHISVKTENIIYNDMQVLEIQWG